MSRIIAGRHGGRRIETPDGPHTRPTTDRVRESFFSALASWAGTADEPVDHWFDGLAFLDLFAGSGAVGLEAASRGASTVLLVERDRATAELCRRNAAALGVPARVRTAAVRTLLAERAPQPFDVCWFDPPYALPSTELDELVAAVLAGGWLARNGVVVLERARRADPPRWPAGLESWSRRYGETVLHWAQPGEDGPVPAGPHGAGEPREPEES
ncbi:16S rRNA (guanine(966)-N(2))-methyltransferase RsmD [Auraticoccus sp. F435]|uniref:16S rRNA (Guanine(966)-N(2))-methyltransferase RsmD n=1 Tax=Auraticoccus cholistanensis TaxID=2656650 RepID=A0A6A9UZA2_9ACTN|nr:16S rRNA (guanine(966)-N(2))-methyltransferase RsmD [Auraticoccus cholistanensis]